MQNRTSQASKNILNRYGRKVAFRPTSDCRITSGSLALDYALGGGIPVGRAMLFWGEKSGGKTSAAVRAAAVGQNRCRNCMRPAKNIQTVPPSREEFAEDPDARWSSTGECTCFAEGLFSPQEPPREPKEKAKEYTDRLVQWREDITKNSYEEFIVTWIDPESAFSKDWSEELGLDTRRLLYVVPVTGEEAVDIIQIILDCGNADMLVVDSLAHFTPRGEYEASAEEWQQGLQARIVNKGIRKFMSGAAKQKRASNTDFGVTQIWMNQTRMKIGVTFGDPTVKPGGKGQEFAVHIEVRFYPSKVEVSEEKYGSDKETTTIPVTEEVHFKITKNKTGPTLGVKESYKQTMRRSGDVPAGTIIEDDFIFKLVMTHLVVEDKKQKEPYILGERTFRTQAMLKDALRDEADLREACRGLVLQRMLEAR